MARVDYDAAVATADEILQGVCHAILHRDPHNAEYQTRRQWVERQCEEGYLDNEAPSDLDEWPALWLAHLYVHTPISFTTGIGPTIEAAVADAMRNA